MDHYWAEIFEFRYRFNTQEQQFYSFNSATASTTYNNPSGQKNERAPRGNSRPDVATIFKIYCIPVINLSIYLGPAAALS